MLTLYISADQCFDNAVLTVWLGLGKKQKQTFVWGEETIVFFLNNLVLPPQIQLETLSTSP